MKQKSITNTVLGSLAALLVVFGIPYLKGKDKNTSESERIIGFYNVENLFDTTHDAGKSDGDFLPDGMYEWNEEKYQIKLHNIATVIKEMAQKNGRYHSVIGLAEVENDHVLADLVACSEIAEAQYSAVHFEGTDGRGIDVAFLYRPSEFKLLDSKVIRYATGTRDALMIRGTLDDEMFAFFVAHLPSRRDDKNEQGRLLGARTVYNEAMSLQKRFPGIKIAVMGDMNDNPGDESMVGELHGRNSVNAAETDFFDPFLEMHEDGHGSEEYRGEWNLFDIIMVNSALADQNSEGYRIQKAGDGYWGTIFNADFLTQQSGRYAGTPLRTFSGSKFLNGYSDHYPTYIKISR